MHGMTLGEVLQQLLFGWDERIEWRERVYAHTPTCQGAPPGISVHDHPFCPVTLVNRTESRPQPSLLAQLADSRWEQPVTARDPGGGGKPKSKMPGNLGDPDEILTSLAVGAGLIASDWGLRPPGTAARALLAAVAAAEPYAGADARAAALRALQGPWRCSRVMLGYEGVWDGLQAACDGCGGQLLVERGNPTVVECGGCDRRIHWRQWVTLTPVPRMP